MSFSFFSRSPWNIGSVAAPWDDRPSIYNHILAHLSAEGSGLKEGGDELPDDDLIRGDTGLGWAPGALDGAFGHHGGGTPSAETAQQIIKAIRALTEKATDDRARRLYSVLLENKTLDYIDALMEGFQGGKIDASRLRSVARWVAMGAPDREPVKTAIAILGLIGSGEDLDLLLTLGRHDEFTLYAAVALSNTEERAEHWLWQLGRYVTGWGRIQIVERLADTHNEQIKDWLLREGYRNDIMAEYTALTCARTGDLAGALRQEQPDNQLLKAAGEILSTLISGRGGPAEGIESYPEGAEAAEAYLRHLRSRELSIEDYNAVTTIKDFLKEEEGEAHDVALGWPQRRTVLLDLTSEILARPDWPEKVRLGLGSEDRLQFWKAAQAAKTLGIDTWEIYFERLQQGEDQWHFVMQTDDRARIERVVHLAEERLPLSEIASGPADEFGFGPEYQAHSALDFVLQDLRRFPGVGWALIRAGLRSPVTRNRNMAARALASWPRQEWPAEADALLSQAARQEPNDDTRELLSKVIAEEVVDL